VIRPVAGRPEIVPRIAKPTRWRFYDPALLLLFPVSYLIHLAEEWFAPAPIIEWWSEAARPLDPARFVIGNAIGLSLMLNGIYLVSRGSRFRWIVPALATAVLLNTAGHFVGSVRAEAYSAGLISGIIFWVPLGLLAMVRVWDQARRRVLIAGIFAGAMIELVVVLTLPRVSA
jgi:Protein of unknown function with HXXEE motif